MNNTEMFSVISTGNILALDHIWLMGDIFLGCAAEQLNMIKKEITPQQLRRWHMLNRYDLRCLYSSVANDGNVLSCLINAVGEGLNCNVQLPRILVLIIDADLCSWVGSYQTTEILIHFVFGQIVASIQDRKLRLPRPAIRTSEP